MPEIRVGDSTLSYEDSQTVQRMLREVAPLTSRELSDAVERLRNEAYARWPVRKYRQGQTQRVPHSRDLISTRLTVYADTILASVRCEASYTYYIKSWQNGLQGKSAFVTLIRTPAQDRAGPLADRLAKELANG